VAVAGADWPNTVAPPAPVTLTVHEAELVLPTYAGSHRPAPTFLPGDPTSAEDPEGVVWSVTRDVLRRTTSCAVGSVSSYDVPYDGRAREEYAGTLTVDVRDHRQSAHAVCDYTLTWPGVEVVRVRATMDLEVSADRLEVHVELLASQGDEVLATRAWREGLPRGT
jgi:uncharacterized protein